MQPVDGRMATGCGPCRQTLEFSAHDRYAKIGWFDGRTGIGMSSREQTAIIAVRFALSHALFTSGDNSCSADGRIVVARAEDGLLPT
jgi:hypothetical protein